MRPITIDGAGSQRATKSTGCAQAEDSGPPMALRSSVLGLTYKPDTSTLRRSASIELSVKYSFPECTMRACDPKADREELKSIRNSSYEDAYAVAETATHWYHTPGLNSGSDFGRLRVAICLLILIPRTCSAPRYCQRWALLTWESAVESLRQTE